MQRNPTTGICFPRGCWVPPGRCDRSPVVGWVECNGTQQRVYVSHSVLGSPKGVLRNPIFGKTGFLG
ncbi:MAG: hypothetical protein P5680_03230 [Limnospira sp. PMC 737.11]|nr:hypothetical protein [Limnospira sp. PMC 737.11]